MTETKPMQDFWSSLKPAAASLSVDDQAAYRPRMSNSSTSNNRLLPNVETIAAMQAARSGKVQSFDSINALLEDLDTPD